MCEVLPIRINKMNVIFILKMLLHNLKKKEAQKCMKMKIKVKK